MNYKKIGAIATHIYTGSGILVAFWAALALLDKNIQSFFIALSIAVVIDASDGTLARYFDVKKNAPSVDGATMDNIIDFITYTFLPAIALVVFDILPQNLTWVALFPLGASIYGFSQTHAKADASFVGFPSYWNILFLYLYILQLPTTWVVIILIFLSVMVFVPIRYIYPSQTRWLQGTTLTLTIIWGAVIIALCFYPDAAWAKRTAQLSLLYPIYYAIISFIYHQRVSILNSEQAALNPIKISVDKK
ncbi:MAG: CDP-diacylglycerol O-phosphatidyltransferase [Anaerolineae bacterium]|jgi:phosphatidylcholine synthase|nr:CDP-diacylglycerol O-phosphatidyltransferase [Anaerolineae bacterium]MBT3713405.1 CDP-diacylglycerol O-phosphatidyltransferase [Anaerolineae bacterium]MBT4311545.1 CDP-diacylglycerol O-phosphatidyltransferase [Anaerolineae bacterium]MBT4457246.1 CDP-diacylglycerol O-phosphatidyltransferase [Anaerolineae bacterium]MBT4842458.1 CDP-diacylglycerol O-phosphatidyltransferase [Anaerolineae bacterium]